MESDEKLVKEESSNEQLPQHQHHQHHHHEHETENDNEYEGQMEEEKQDEQEYNPNFDQNLHDVVDPQRQIQMYPDPLQDQHRIETEELLEEGSQNFEEVFEFSFLFFL